MAGQLKQGMLNWVNRGTKQETGNQYTSELRGKSMDCKQEKKRWIWFV